MPGERFLNEYARNYFAMKPEITEAEKHMRKKHSVSIEVVGNEELTICKTCKMVLVTKKIDVS